MDFGQGMIVCLPLPTRVVWRLLHWGDREQHRPTTERHDLLSTLSQNSSQLTAKIPAGSRWAVIKPHFQVVPCAGGLVPHTIAWRT